MKKGIVFLVGVCWLSFGGTSILQTKGMVTRLAGFGELFSLASLFYIVIGIFLISVAFGLFLFQRWGRDLTLVTLVILLFFSIFFLIFSLFAPSFGKASGVYMSYSELMWPIIWDFLMIMLSFSLLVFFGQSSVRDMFR